MIKIHQLRLTFGLLVFLMLTACSQATDTKNWEKFTIEELPGFDIQIPVPADWKVNYLPPMEVGFGQWKVTLTPPRCSTDQTEDYTEECITLTAYIKGQAEFDEDAVLTLISQNITLSEEQNTETILMGQNSFDVDDVTIQRFNHKIPTSTGEVQLSYFYFQTEGAYYTIMTNFPYEESDGKVAETFQKMLQGIEVVR